MKKLERKTKKQIEEDKAKKMAEKIITKYGKTFKKLAYE